MIEIEAGHTHFYPGARCRAAQGTARPPDPGQTLPARIVFADGSHADATIEASPGGYVLRVGPYRTAAGTGLPARAWVAEPLAGSAMGEMRITRLAGPGD